MQYIYYQFTTKTLEGTLAMKIDVNKQLHHMPDLNSHSSNVQSGHHIGDMLFSHYKNECFGCKPDTKCSIPRNKLYNFLFGWIPFIHHDMTCAERRSKFYDFLFRQSAIHRVDERRVRKAIWKCSHPKFGLYNEAIDLSKGVIVTVLGRFSGRTGRTDISITARLLQSSSFIQGMELCEEAISEGLYAQAGALVRQELECIAAMEESKIGRRDDNATPNVSYVPWKLRTAYGQLSMMAHTSSMPMLDTIHSISSGSTYLASAVPAYKEQMARMLIGLHAALTIQLAIHLDILYLDMHDEGLTPLELDSLQMAMRTLQEEGFFKKSSGYDNVITITEEDSQLDEAIQKARDSLPSFIKVLQEPKVKGRNFMIKACFVEKSFSEHIWISDITLKDDIFHGMITNEPKFIRRLRLRQPVKINRDKVTDWVIEEKGKSQGAFTTAVLQGRTSGNAKTEE